jgi:hypothetical protein
MTAPVVSSDTIAMLAMVQKPDLVSSILRSSVVVIRPKGMLTGTAVRTRCWTMVMRALLRAGCLR